MFKSDLDYTDSVGIKLPDADLFEMWERDIRTHFRNN